MKANQAQQVIEEAASNPAIKVSTKKTNAYGLRVILTYHNRVLRPRSLQDWREIKQCWEVIA